MQPFLRAAKNPKPTAAVTRVTVMMGRAMATAAVDILPIVVGVLEGVGAKDIEGSIVAIVSCVLDCVGKIVVTVAVLARMMEDLSTLHLAINVILVEDIPPSLHPIALPLMAGLGIMRRGSVCIPPVVLRLPVSMPNVAKSSSSRDRDTFSPLGKPMFTCGSIISNGRIVQEQKVRIGSWLPSPFKQNEKVF
jgi:hypothetical protein